jgi:hypothetical protein
MHYSQPSVIVVNSLLLAYTVLKPIKTRKNFIMKYCQIIFPLSNNSPTLGKKYPNIFQTIIAKKANGITVGAESLCRCR